MATITISVFRAYDSSSEGMIGTYVPDMFQKLEKPITVEETKMEKIMEHVTKYCNEYHAAHPLESFMPSINCKGRKPRGFDNATKPSNADMRNWLLTKPATA